MAQANLGQLPFAANGNCPRSTSLSVGADGERAWAPAEAGTVPRGLDVYRVRDGRIVAKDVYGKITTPY